jgi:hypothetical protein
VDVVALQLTTHVDEFFVGIGVADTEVYEASWVKPLGDFVREPDCTVRTRLGRPTTGRDQAWFIGDTDGPSQVARRGRSGSGG